LAKAREEAAAQAREDVLEKIIIMCRNTEFELEQSCGISDMIKHPQYVVTVCRIREEFEKLEESLRTGGEH
jgi:hypothetical protein